MHFNRDPSKPAQEVLFSRKKKIQIHANISLNNIQVVRAPYQKHLGILLGKKLKFKQHVDYTIMKVSRGMSVTKKLRYSLPLKSLVTTHKAFLRSLIDYRDIIYDQTQNESFCKKKLESTQYRAALVITGAIEGTSHQKIYQELGLESLKSKRRYRRLSYMFKTMKEKAPNS